MKYFACAFAMASLIGSSSGPALAASVRVGPGGDAKALVIGANKYKEARELFGAKQDAEDIGQALKAVGFEVKPLLEEEATRTSIVQAMNDLVAGAKRNDLIVISVAGHGDKVELEPWKNLEADGKSRVFVLPNFATQGPGTKEIIANKEFKAWLSRLHAKGAEVIFVADTCFAGNFTRGSGVDSVRYADRGSSIPPGRGLFQPIPMTTEEAKTEIGRLPHVTFLSGVDGDTPSPEVEIGGQRRGLLSYAFARLIEGRGVSPDGVVSRRVLYQIGQIVRQESKEQQQPFFEPNPQIDSDPATYERALFYLLGARPEPAPSGLPTTKITAINGEASALDKIGRPTAPFERVSEPRSADLVWDLAAKSVLGHGDVILSSVEPSSVAGIIDRTSAIAALGKISEPRALEIALKEGGRLYSKGARDNPSLMVQNVKGRNLLVFNIAADGRLQMLRPARGEDPISREDRFDYPPEIVEPFGADTIVAVASSKPLDKLQSWLWSVDNLTAAGRLPAKLTEAIAADPSIKIGYTGLYTGP